MWQSLRSRFNSILKWVNIYLAHFQLHILSCNLGCQGDVHYICLPFMFPSFYSVLSPRMKVFTGIEYYCLKLWSLHEDMILCRSFDLSCPLLQCVFCLSITKTWSWCATPVHIGTLPATEEDTIHENVISWSKAHFFLYFCNNSSNEKENEITSRNRWSMTSIHQLGHMLWFSLHFLPAFTCTCNHMHTVLQMPYRR